MQKVFPPLLVAAVLLFVTAPLMVAQAPYESTMGLVQKIFYYHAAVGDGDVPGRIRERRRPAPCICFGATRPRTGWRRPAQS